MVRDINSCSSSSLSFFKNLYNLSESNLKNIDVFKDDFGNVKLVLYFPGNWIQTFPKFPPSHELDVSFGSLS